MTPSNESIPKKNIVFDVVGTLTSYDTFYAAIEKRLGPLLREHGVPAEVFGFMWIEVAEREYAYASISSAYTPYETCLRALFYRILWKAGVTFPRERASEADLDAIMSAYNHMPLRPGAASCVRTLQEAGFRVWYFTMGGVSRVASWLREGGVEVVNEGRIVGCDSDGVGKPDLRAYTPLFERLRESSGAMPWFAAAHAWDVGAAGRAGFRTAYCTVWEKEPLPELFGEMDVVADTLPEMAGKVVAAVRSE